MDDVISYIRKKASGISSVKIVLPEWKDPRIIKAVEKIRQDNISEIILTGSKEEIKKNIKPDLYNDVEIFDTSDQDNIDELVKAYKKLSCGRDSETDEVIGQGILDNKVYVASLLCRLGKAEGFVAGAVYTSKSVIKAAIDCFEKESGISRISSSFLMVVPDCRCQKDGFFIFSDCGVNKDPNPFHLVDITISSVELLNSVFSSIEPKVALLSYSTKGSAEGTSVKKIREALEIIKSKMPDLIIDGELQVDAALVESVAEKKASQSKIKGNANILIFPNLESGNISYKLVQRLADARAVGPLLNGFTFPCSDLSRGCEIDDIIDAVSITVIRSVKDKK